MNGIESSMNLFSIPPRDALYNEVTGIKVPDDVKNDIVSCQEIGEEWHSEFPYGCFVDH